MASAAGAVFLLGFGEELWKRFVPKYLEALGAGAVPIGLYGAAEDFFDAVYQFPGGTIADRLGRRRAFPLFIGVASLGYLVYLLTPSWPWVFVALALAAGWNSMASPATFAVIADALPRGRRAMGFTVQSILRRIPRLVSPVVGGALIGAFGVVAGMRIGFAATLVLAALTLLVVSRMDLPALPSRPMRLAGVWRAFDPALRRLLLSDVVIRTCEGLAGVFVILYVTTVRGFSVPAFSLLLAIQVATSILVYFPAARMADRIGRKPFVTATFLAFALFPVTVALASGFPAMAIAFVVGGLREIGEPSRKAMIVDAADAELRGRTVGLYYLVRGISVTPAAVIGGLLWRISPATPFYVAGAVGLAGVALFVATVEERYAG
ncbi:MAG TPA: MFS transporter [Gemmatimonadota bacterium]|nr:MFS transporter [Gemmatimonadota bacterium]